MGRRTLIYPAAALGLALACGVLAHACTPGDASVTIVPRPPGQACTLATPSCDGGMTCNNSVCVPTCASGTCSAADTYCSTPGSPPPLGQICAAKAPTRCTANANCPGQQVCKDNLCTSFELLADGGSGPCTPQGAAVTDDACPSDAICRTVTDPGGSGSQVNRCLGLPVCGEDGSCPIGPGGTACNDLGDGGRLFVGKGRVCVPGFCLKNSDCPSNTYPHCAVPNPPDPIGVCTTGGANSFCGSDADCTQGNTHCLPGPDGGVKLCR